MFGNAVFFFLKIQLYLPALPQNFPQLSLFLIFFFQIYNTKSIGICCMFFLKNQLYFPALPQNFPKLSLFLFFSNLLAIYVCLIYLMSYTVINNKKNLKHYVCHFWY